MKTKQITYLLLAGILILVTACNWPAASNDDGDQPLACEGENGQIKREEAVKMVDDFLLVNNMIIERDLPYINTKGDTINYSHSPTVHFSLEDMKCFIEYVESFEGDYNNLGIRAYLAAKDNGKGNYETTILFAPTGYPMLKNSSDSIQGNPNIPGTNLLNHGTAGMPPSGTELTNP